MNLDLDDDAADLAAEQRHEGSSQSVLKCRHCRSSFGFFCFSPHQARQSNAKTVQAAGSKSLDFVCTVSRHAHWPRVVPRVALDEFPSGITAPAHHCCSQHHLVVNCKSIISFSHSLTHSLTHSTYITASTPCLPSLAPSNLGPRPSPPMRRMGTQGLGLYPLPNIRLKQENHESWSQEPPMGSNFLVFQLQKDAVSCSGFASWHHIRVRH